MLNASIRIALFTPNKITVVLLQLDGAGRVAEETGGDGAQVPQAFHVVLFSPF